MADNPWYKAKEVILKLHDEGKIAAGMTVREVYNMEEHQEIFRAVRWERFRDNFNRLKRSDFKQATKKTDHTRPRIKMLN